MTFFRLKQSSKVCLAAIFIILGYFSLIPALFWTFIYKWFTSNDVTTALIDYAKTDSDWSVKCVLKSISLHSMAMYFIFTYNISLLDFSYYMFLLPEKIYVSVSDNQLFMWVVTNDWQVMSHLSKFWVNSSVHSAQISWLYTINTQKLIHFIFFRWMQNEKVKYQFHRKK